LLHSTEREEEDLMARLNVGVFSLLATVTAIFVGCGGQPASVPTAATPDSAVRGSIKHIVVIVQENRSFDNLFYGYPGADTAKSRNWCKNGARLT